MWVPDKDGVAMWEGLLDGTVDTIGTDHAPHTREEKEIGWTDMYASPGGMPIVEHFLSLFLTEVNAGRLTLERLVEVCASNPARLAGFYPRKGAIAVGADADLVVLDMERRHTITAANSHYKCGWTPLEGREVHGLPVLTMLRGCVIAQDGEVLVEPGYGRFQLPVARL
jgi:dihydroorotase-like cyclic amidohydrolase